MDLYRTRRIVSLLALSVLVGCGGDGPSGPRIPAKVSVTPAQGTLTVTGGTVQLSAQPQGKKGKALTGIPVVWSSADPSVAVVDQTGLVTAVSPGMALVQATASGVMGGATITVALEPAQVEIVAGDDQTGEVGAILEDLLKIQIKDGAGAPIPGVPVDFSVTEGGGLVFPPRVVTDGDGMVQTQWKLGQDPKQPQKLKASVGGLFNEIRATAQWPPLNVVTTSPNRGRLTVQYSGGLQASGGAGAPYSWSVSEGSLPPGLSLSPVGEISGTPTQDGWFAFTADAADVEGTSVSQEMALQVCALPTPLELGEVRVFGSVGEAGCGIFIPSGTAGERYRVGIVRSETNRDSRDLINVTLEVQGLGVEPGLELDLPPELFAPPSPSDLLDSSDLRKAEELANSTEAFHWRLRDEERKLLQRLPPDFQPLPSIPRDAPQVVAARSQAAPERLSLRFPSDGCAGVATKPALLLGENEDVAIYQDSVQILTEPVSVGAVGAMLNYYRDYGKQVIDGYFGGVSDVNGDGQVVVFIAPGVKDGVAGFVRSSDMLSRGLCSSSNEMEITYLKASFVNGFDNGGYQLVGTLVHEIKHISSLYRRLVARSFHPTWVEEGTAEIATDRASRLAMAGIGGPGVGDMLTLADIETYGRTLEGYNTRLRLSRSLRFMASQPNSVTVNPDGAAFMSQSGLQERHTIYGAGWHFHRWLGDAYGDAASPLADTTLFRIQNDSLTVPGPDAYPGLVGRSFQELMTEFAAAVMLNGAGAPAPVRGFSSVDFPSAMSSFSVYSQGSRPFGVYPWPVTNPLGGVEIPPGRASLQSASYSGVMGESGIRIHDFTSNGTGQGAEVSVFAPTGASVVLVRLR